MNIFQNLFNIIFKNKTAYIQTIYQLKLFSNIFKELPDICMINNLIKEQKSLNNDINENIIEKIIKKIPILKNSVIEDITDTFFNQNKKNTKKIYNNPFPEIVLLNFIKFI